MVIGMAEKYGKAHFEKVAFSESCHKSAFLGTFHFWLHARPLIHVLLDVLSTSS